MSSLAIRAESLGKRYRIGAAAARSRTLKEALESIATAPLRNLGRLRRLSAFENGDEHEVLWALRDVSFDLEHGEVLGVIGRNGAGKSTLLKILSRITPPTTGRARVVGRVGSLLEIGTGFHPELTGRDNVYLNGSILGMNRAHITRTFDEIVEFAGVEAFIDTPVKRYSSGMHVRLAFAVAAHFEPDVMIVDEVLAVGDAEFQRRCLAKMDDVARGGRTVLFVSHNMNAIQRLCTRCMMLEGGRLIAEGPTAEIIHRYLRESLERSVSAVPERWISLRGVPRRGTGDATFESVRYVSDNAAIRHQAYSGGPVEFTLELKSDITRRVSSLALTISDQHGTKLVNADSVALGRSLQLQQGQTVVSLRIEALHLRPGTYVVGFWLAEATHKVYDFLPAALLLEVADLQQTGFGGRTPGVVNCEFSVNELSTSVSA